MLLRYEIKLLRTFIYTHTNEEVITSTKQMWGDLKRNASKTSDQNSVQNTQPWQNFIPLNLKTFVRYKSTQWMQILADSWQAKDKKQYV